MTRDARIISCKLFNFSRVFNPLSTNHKAKLSRSHNNANVLSLPARFLEKKEAIEIVEIFLNTEFEGGRHERRVNKINKKDS